MPQPQQQTAPHPSPSSSSSSSRPTALIGNLRESDIYEKYVRARFGRNNLVLDNANTSPCKNPGHSKITLFCVFLFDIKL